MILWGHRFIVALFIMAWPIAVFAGPCRTDTLEMRGDWGQVRFSVEVADTASGRAQGLMYRTSMPKMSGMLFVFPRPRPVSFWMRNTYIPLDMLFMDHTGTVTRIHANAIPEDETAIPGGPSVQYVLELNAGMAARLGIDVGSEMRHPSVPSAVAAWSCG
jgi:uncharacterized membrane protein (UPF0127 family)